MSGSPRVLIFHPALPPYRVDTFNALAERLQLRLVFLRPNLLSQRFDQERLRSQLRAEHGYLAGGFTVARRTVRLGVGREIARFRPDVVVTQEFSPTTAMALAHRPFARHRYAHVVWTDDNPLSVSRDRWFRRLSRRAVLPTLDGLIVLSDEAVQLYRQQYGAKVPMGVSPIVYEEGSFRAQLSLAHDVARASAQRHGLDGQRVVLFVGRLAPEKRVDRLLRAFARVRAGTPGLKLALVGDGPEREALERLAASLGVTEQTVFAGRLEGAQLHAWYLLGGVFALASEFEPYGAVVNEALLAGLPAVVSDRAGARGLVREGENGTVVDAADEGALADALATWLARVEPVRAGALGDLRPSRMGLRFVDAVDAIVDVVRRAAGHSS